MGGWAKQNSSFAMVKCNLTAETWYLSCTGTEWNGSAGNCNVSKYLEMLEENVKVISLNNIVITRFLNIIPRKSVTLNLELM